MYNYDPLPEELEIIDNHIVFQFVEEVDRNRKGAFKEITDWGFELGTSIEDTTKKSRWVIVIGVGPEAAEEGFAPGDKVLVQNLMWTRVVEYKGIRFARTDTKHILAIEEE